MSHRGENAHVPGSIGRVGVRTVVHVFTLFTLALAQPIYALLAAPDHAPFLFAHHTRAVDLGMFVAFVSIAVPMAACVLLWGAGRLSRKLGNFLLSAVVLILLCVIALPILTKLSAAPAPLATFIALGAGSLGTYLYHRTRWFPLALSIMSLGILAAPAMFLDSANVQSVVASAGAEEGAVGTSRAEHPDIVMIVFDELPLISLLNHDRDIDPEMFPNFARLARRSNWYRNTASVHYSTNYAVAALLVGQELSAYRASAFTGGPPPHGQLDREQLPYSIFSLLGPDYAIFAQELVTHLAPPVAPTHPYVPALQERFPELLEDAAVVYAHMILPESLAASLPHIEGQWRGFVRPAHGELLAEDWPFEDSFKRLAAIRDFIDSLQKRDRPSFYFLHSLLPHYPFEYNENGQLYPNQFRFLTMHFREATGSNDWPDQAVAELVYAAHLRQLAFLDKLLGRILDRLEAQAMFDDALIVLTSDHGTNYYWDDEGLPREDLANIQAAGTVLVPWFLKLPRQSDGHIIDTPLQTIDIVPTLAAALNIEPSWPAGGVSAFGDVPADRVRYALLPHRMTFRSLEAASDQAFAYKLRLLEALAWPGERTTAPTRAILGRPVEDFDSMTSSAAVRLTGPERFRSVQPGSTRVPAFVEGSIAPGTGPDPEFQHIAVTVNGIVRSLTRPSNFQVGSLSASWRKSGNGRPGSQDDMANNPAGPRQLHFTAYLPSKHLSKGRNEIGVYGVLCRGPEVACQLITFEGSEQN
jgi:hypothetical protein